MSIKVTQASPKCLGLLSAARARRSSDQIGGRALAAGLSEKPLVAGTSVAAQLNLPGKHIPTHDVPTVSRGWVAVQSVVGRESLSHLLDQVDRRGWNQPILARRFQIGCAVSPDITSLGYFSIYVLRWYRSDVPRPDYPCQPPSGVGNDNAYLRIPSAAAFTTTTRGIQRIEPREMESDPMWSLLPPSFSPREAEIEPAKLSLALLAC